MTTRVPRVSWRARSKVALAMPHWLPYWPEPFSRTIDMLYGSAPESESIVRARGSEAVAFGSTQATLAASAAIAALVAETVADSRRAWVLSVSLRSVVVPYLALI